jgi:hypothetical protein
VSGIFLSYSSKDKQFVERIALDFAQYGYPVWLDQWRLEVSAHLTNSLQIGVDAADYLLVMLSEHSGHSPWIADELAWGLARERRLGRPFVIPILLDDCQIPSTLSDRKYADFTRAYEPALHALLSSLRDWGVLKRLPFQWSRVDVPINVNEGIHLDSARLHSCLKALSQRKERTTLREDESLLASQVHIAPDDVYEKQRRRAEKGLQSNSVANVADLLTLQKVRNAYEYALKSEDWLLEGIAKICSEAQPLGGLDGKLADCSALWACEYFTLIVRSHILACFLIAQSEDDQDKFPSVVLRCEVGPLRNRETAAKTYGLDAMVPVTLTDQTTPYGHNFYIPDRSPFVEYLRSHGKMAWSVVGQGNQLELVSKYLVPQTLAWPATTLIALGENVATEFDLTGSELILRE